MPIGEIRRIRHLNSPHRSRTDPRVHTVTGEVRLTGLAEGETTPAAARDMIDFEAPESMSLKLFDKVQFNIQADGKANIIKKLRR